MAKKTRPQDYEDYDDAPEEYDDEPAVKPILKKKKKSSGAKQPINKTPVIVVSSVAGVILIYLISYFALVDRCIDMQPRQFNGFTLAAYYPIARSPRAMPGAFGIWVDFEQTAGQKFLRIIFAPVHGIDRMILRRSKWRIDMPQFGGPRQF